MDPEVTGVVATPAPAEAPAIPATPVVEPAAPTEQPGAPESPTPTVDQETRRRLYAEADPDELLQHNPKLKRSLDGRAGQLADKLAKERVDALAPQRVKELQIEQLESQERELRATDPYRAAELRTEVERRRDELRQEAEKAAAPSPDAVLSNVMSGLASFQATLPEPVRKKLEGKAYPGTFEQGFHAYMADVVAEVRAHERARYEREDLPVLRKQALSQVNGGEPSVDLGGGPSAGAKVITNAEVRRMSLDEYDNYFDKNGEPKPGVVFRPK